MCENYKDSFLKKKNILESQLRIKSDHHDMYTEEVNKIALNSSDNERLQTFNGVRTYPYGTSAFKMCESEMMIVRDIFLETMQIVSFITKPYLYGTNTFKIC